jgi:phage head maturation protease
LVLTRIVSERFARAREALALMREGAVDGLSIGFRAERSIKDVLTGGRRLQKIDLQEISLVTFPMPRARVTAVKRREIDAIVRDGTIAPGTLAAANRPAHQISSAAFHRGRAAP